MIFSELQSLNTANSDYKLSFAPWLQSFTEDRTHHTVVMNGLTIEGILLT